MFFSKKSQLTMIIIIGLLVVIVFAFLLSLKKDLAKNPNSQDKLLYEIESGLIKDHVSSCIERVTSDAVERIGANGGVIYDFEGGTLPFNSFTAEKNYTTYQSGARTFFIQYGLKENSYCSALSYAFPDYPVAGKQLSELSGTYIADDTCNFAKTSSDFDGTLGEVTLSKLCPFSSDSSCLTFAKGEQAGLTIKNQIEDYLSKKLELCVNISYFGEQYNAEISVDQAPVSRVSIRDTDIQVSVTYPLKIKFKDAQPISKVVEYHSQLNVRLGQMYSFLYDVLSKDSRDISFNLETSSLASSFWSKGFELKKIKNSCTTCGFPAKYDDLVEVTDSESILNGKAFVFRAIVQDRRPVLDLILNTTSDLATVPSTFELNIPIKAVDPDDTEVNYYFLSEGLTPGWREFPPLPASPIELQPNGNTLKFFLSARDDFGLHDVTVLSLDESGFFDFQRFKIEVRHSGLLNPPSTDCMDDCTFSAPNCERWCLLTANNCASECSGTFSYGDSTCRNCAEPLFFVSANEAHIQCNGLTELDCKANVPDCFWIEETGGASPSSSSCKNDYDLEGSLRYSAIKS